MSAKVLPVLVPVSYMEREQQRSRRASKKRNFVDSSSPTYSPVNKICIVSHETEDDDFVFKSRRSLRYLISDSTDLSNSCSKTTPESSRRKRTARNASSTSKAESKTPLHDNSSLVLSSSTEARGITIRRRCLYAADESFSEFETKSITSSPSSSFYSNVKSPLSIANENSRNIISSSTRSTTSKSTRSASTKARRATLRTTARRRQLYCAGKSSPEEIETLLNVPVRNSLNTSGEGFVTPVVKSIDESLMDKENSCNLSALTPTVVTPVTSSAKGRRFSITCSTPNPSTPKTCSLQRGGSSKTSRSNLRLLNEEHEIVSNKERENQKNLLKTALRKLCERNPRVKEKYEQIQNQKALEKIDITQILKGVTAYVEVRDEYSDFSDYVSQRLTEMGASVSKSLKRTVTHFIFRNGKKSSYDKAKNLGIFVVSILWITSCKEARAKLPETEFEAVVTDFSRKKYRSKLPSDVIRLRKTPISKNTKTSFYDTPISGYIDTTGVLMSGSESSAATSVDADITGNLSGLVPTSPTFMKPLTSSNDEWLSTQERMDFEVPLIDRLTTNGSFNISVDRTPKFVQTLDELRRISTCSTPTSSRVVGRRQTLSEDATPLMKIDENLPSIVVTNFHSDERELVGAIINNIGGFNLKCVVDQTTTHVVCGEKRRTLNVLYATVRGCWLLDKEWVYRSLEKGDWVDEEAYELFDAYPAAQISRLERVVAECNRHKIFNEVGPIFIAGNIIPPKPTLQELILLCGGNVVQCQRHAKISIGTVTRNVSVLPVAATWILDSIMENSIMPIESYILRT